MTKTHTHTPEKDTRYKKKTIDQLRDMEANLNNQHIGKKFHQNAWKNTNRSRRDVYRNEDQHT